MPQQTDTERLTLLLIVSRDNLYKYGSIFCLSQPYQLTLTIDDIDHSLRATPVCVETEHLDTRVPELDTTAHRVRCVWDKGLPLSMYSECA